MFPLVVDSSEFFCNCRLTFFRVHQFIRSVRNYFLVRWRQRLK